MQRHVLCIRNFFDTGRPLFLQEFLVLLDKHGLLVLKLCHNRKGTKEKKKKKKEEEKKKHTDTHKL